MITATEIQGFIGSGIGKSIVVILILVFTIVIERSMRKFLDSSFRKSSKIIKVDHTQYSFLKHSMTAVIYVVGAGLAVYLIPPLRTLSISILAGAGVLAVIIGFASQQAFANIIGGIFIVIFKPFRVTDRVKIDDTVEGIVEDITLRHTVIRTYENKRIIIPNAVISNDVIENSDLGEGMICKFIEFDISYESNIDKAMKIMREESMKHPNFLDNRTEKDKKAGISPIRVKVIGIKDSSIRLRAWVWTKDQSSGFEMGCDLMKNIKERFDKEGIEIPYPHKTIVYKKDLKKKR